VVKKAPTPAEEGTVYDHVPEGMLSRREAGLLIGKSYDTIRRWHESGIYKSTNFAQMGKNLVHLYDPADIKAMKKLARTIKPGPEKGI
jgi:hypothetical protein